MTKTMFNNLFKVLELTPLEMFMELLRQWNALEKAPVTNNTIFRATMIVQHAYKLQEANFYLKKLKYEANEYNEIRCKFPRSLSKDGVDVTRSFVVQYLEAFEGFQKEMATSKNKLFLCLWADIAATCRELDPVGVSEVTLPEEPLYNKYVNIGFPKPTKYPLTFELVKK